LIYFVLKTGPLALYLCMELEFVFATAGVRAVGKIGAGLSAALLSHCTSAENHVCNYHGER